MLLPLLLLELLLLEDVLHPPELEVELLLELLLLLETVMLTGAEVVLPPSLSVATAVSV